MGWKAVRDHYRIEHIVHVDGGDLVVGSGYVPRIIKVTPEGGVHVFVGARRGEIDRIATEMEADRGKLLALIEATDEFSAAIPVYTWSGADILLRHCEETGWPNVTHDGDLMYENRYSEDRDEVLGWARDSAADAVADYDRMVREAGIELARLEADLQRAIAVQAALASPDAPDPTPVAD